MILWRLRSYISSTHHLLLDLPSHVQQGTKLFTADAVSMYTNIDTTHALETLKIFFQTHPICCDLDWEPTFATLKIIMTQNIVQFSDKYFVQQCGTAMGTPPAPTYATIYFGIHEL